MTDKKHADKKPEAKPDKDSLEARVKKLEDAAKANGWSSHA